MDGDDAEFQRQVTAAVSAQLRVLATEIERDLPNAQPQTPPWIYAYAATKLRDQADILDREASVIGIVTEWRVVFPSGESRYYADNEFPEDPLSGEIQCRETILLSDWRLWDED